MALYNAGLITLYLFEFFRRKFARRILRKSLPDALQQSHSNYQSPLWSKNNRVKALLLRYPHIYLIGQLLKLRERNNFICKMILIDMPKFMHQRLPTAIFA